MQKPNINSLTFRDILLTRTDAKKAKGHNSVIFVLQFFQRKSGKLHLSLNQFTKITRMFQEAVKQIFQQPFRVKVTTFVTLNCLAYHITFAYFSFKKYSIY